MKIAYRPEVDGLRTLAVFMVIFHHLSFSLFKGGFVGVDVFFVISGYLITSILAKDMSRGVFSLGEFYKRRIIRLAPAYFIVIFITSIYAFYIMLPVERVEYSWSALSSLIFSANFYMWKTVGGYFGGGSEAVPLLHLWTLAVEEQFYVFWPLALFVIARIFTKWSNVVVAIGVVCALVLSEWATQRLSPSFTYFILPSRAFELLIGASLALFPLSVYKKKLPASLNGILCILGLGLIFYANFFFGKDTAFPGLNALIPCLGTALLIVFMEPKKQLVGGFFSNKVMVSIGKVSYPAYLWHWPIIAFLNIQLIEINALISVAVVITTLSLSYFTYQFIELPARKFRNYKTSQVVLCGFVLPGILFAATLFYVINMKGEVGKANVELESRASAIHFSAQKARPGCSTGEPVTPLGPNQCILGVEGRQVDFLLVGDSHASHFTGMLNSIALDAGIRGYDVTLSNTAYLPGVERYFYQQGRLKKHLGFSARNNYITDFLLPNKYKYVVLGMSVVGAYSGFWMYADEQSDAGKKGIADSKVFERGVERAVQQIISNGSIPVIMADSPNQDRDVASCTLNNLRFNLSVDCRMEKTEYKIKFSEWLVFLAKVKRSYPQIIIIDPAKVMCDKDYCYSELKGTPLYHDKGHLNYVGSQLIGELYIQEFGNPFKQ